MREALIGAGGALTGALIAGLVAFLVNERASNWKYEEWLLNHRQKAYVEMLLAMQELMSLGLKSAHDDRLRANSKVFAAYIQVILVATPNVEKALPAAINACKAHVPIAAATVQIADAAGDLQDVMRADLQRQRTETNQARKIF